MNQEDKYTYRVFWSEEDGEFVGLCAEFLSLSWLAKADVETLGGIKTVVRGVLADMKKNAELTPELLASKKYSGAFKVRIASRRGRPCEEDCLATGAVRWPRRQFHPQHAEDVSSAGPRCRAA
jgi:hypothetical protein